MGLQFKSECLVARRTTLAFIVVCVVIANSVLMAQQKGQWMPGQVGLDAGILPNPGVSIYNITLAYSSSRLNDSRGNSVPIQGSYNIWAVGNYIYFVPSIKFLGGHLAFMVAQPTPANGSLTVPQFGIDAGGFGLADTYVQPFTLGWSTKRIAFNTAYAFFAPHGATNNVGSGYWGNDFLTGTTLYLTKNQGTTANLYTVWEFHGTRQEINNARITPGQTFTTEWGLGQILPLKKDLSMLAQFGGVGYDQWQVSANGGVVPSPIVGAPLIPASLLPYYSVHAAGLEANFIVPKNGFSLSFKYYWEYLAKARPQGATLGFGATWTFRIPKAKKAP